MIIAYSLKFTARVNTDFNVWIGLYFFIIKAFSLIGLEIYSNAIYKT